MDKPESDETLTNVMRFMANASVEEHQKFYVVGQYYEDQAHDIYLKQGADPTAYTMYRKAYNYYNKALNSMKTIEGQQDMSAALEKNKSEVTEKILSMKDPLREKQVKTIIAIHNSEAQYQKDLAKLLKFYRMFELEFAPGDDRDTIPRVFCESAIKIIEHNHAQIFEDLQKMDPNQPKIKNIISAFEYPQVFRAYKAFVQQYSCGAKKRNDYKSNSKFQAFCKETDQSMEELNDLVGLPLQRLPTYARLLDELLSNIPTLDKNYGPIKSICDHFKDIAKEVRDAEAKFENMDMLLDLGTRVGQNLVQPNRRLLLQGLLKVKSGNPLRPLIERKFYLCSDVLLWVDSRDSLKGVLELRDSRLKDMPPSEKYSRRGIYLTGAMTIGSHTEQKRGTVSIITGSDVEKKQWKDLIENQIDEAAQIYKQLEERRMRSPSVREESKHSYEGPKFGPVDGDEDGEDEKEQKSDSGVIPPPPPIMSVVEQEQFALETLIYSVRSFAKKSADDAKQELESLVVNLGQMNKSIWGVLNRYKWDLFKQRFKETVDFDGLETALLNLIPDSTTDYQREDSTKSISPPLIHQASSFTSNGDVSSPITGIPPPPGDEPPPPEMSPLRHETSKNERNLLSLFAESSSYRDKQPAKLDASFESGPQQIIYSGWLQLQKSGGVSLGANAISTSKKRYFVLRENGKLQYYKHDFTANALQFVAGELDITEVKRCETFSAKSPQWGITLELSHETVVLGAPDQPKQRVWAQHIRNMPKIYRQKSLTNLLTPTGPSPAHKRPISMDARSRGKFNDQIKFYSARRKKKGNSSLGDTGLKFKFSGASAGPADGPNTPSRSKIGADFFTPPSFVPPVPEESTLQGRKVSADSKPKNTTMAPPPEPFATPKPQNPTPEPVGSPTTVVASEKAEGADNDPMKWSNGKVVDWLCGFGPNFTAYRDAFVADGVDGKTLLTDINDADDLSDLVDKSRHRKRLFREIGILKEQCK